MLAALDAEGGMDPAEVAPVECQENAANRGSVGEVGNVIPPQQPGIPGRDHVEASRLQGLHQSVPHVLVGANARSLDHSPHSSSMIRSISAWFWR